ARDSIGCHAACVARGGPGHGARTKGMEALLDWGRRQCSSVQRAGHCARWKVRHGAAAGGEAICTAGPGAIESSGRRGEKEGGGVRHDQGGSVVEREIPRAAAKCDHGRKFWAAACSEWRGAFAARGGGFSGGGRDIGFCGASGESGDCAKYVL